MFRANIDIVMASGMRHMFVEKECVICLFDLKGNDFAKANVWGLTPNKPA